MSMTDPIADLLTRVRNNTRVGYATVEAPASRLKEEICRVLKSEGFILDYERVEDGKQGVLKITLKYTHEQDSVIQGIKRVSKPSLRVYSRSKNLKPVRSGLGIAIVSTSKGVMTTSQARDERLGGEILCEVW